MNTDNSSAVGHSSHDPQRIAASVTQFEASLSIHPVTTHASRADNASCCTYPSTDPAYVYKNVVAQMLRARGEKLYYHTWPTPSGKHNYEIDFILSRGHKIVPVEVKSSGYKTHKSIDEFCVKFASQVGQRYLVYAKDLREDGALFLIPAYMCMFI